MVNRYIPLLMILTLLLPNLSYGFIDDEYNVNHNTNIRFRDSMLIDIENIEYDSNIARVIIIGDEPVNHVNILYQFSINDKKITIGYMEKDKIKLLDQDSVIIDQPLNFLLDDVSKIQEITNANLAINNGFDGNNTKIAIVDTGTDFSNIDMQDAIARGEDNKPIMLDADAQGIVLTKTKFIAKFDNGKIINNTDIIYDDYTSDVYVNNDGVFLRAIRENKTKFQIYNPLYPLLSPLIFNATANGDWKIGNSADDYIRSASGIYRMGFIIEPNFHLGRFGLIIVPVLVIDSKEPNVYDTIIPDMSDAWIDFAIFELRKSDLEFDYDFTDEIHRVIGDGNELLVYDADNDNEPDLSAGTLGANVVDLWGAINGEGKFDPYTGLIDATVLAPMDTNGTYFGIMYDYFGHGTATASTIVSKGINTYDIYGNGTNYKIDGIAPNAKIIPVKALWFGDTPYAWLWTSGFELINGTWQYTGKHKADIINNSWSIPVFTLIDYAPGYDPISILADILSTPKSLSEDYPGTLIVTSAGNSGYGHGTISAPAASPLSLTVGA
ncbi:MAG: peptidase S8, partial [Candidatus Nitrosothermus koennekii]